MATWDPEQYLRFSRERARPFHDLVAAVVHPGPRLVTDLGCGPGGLTATLLERWPGARICGIDGSAEMIARARGRAVSGRLHFEQGDVRTWRPAGPQDVILSNACFHWIPDHRGLLEHLCRQLAPGGVLAFQVPNNYAEPTHTLLDELIASPEWTGRLGGVPRTAVEAPVWYIEQLGRLGLEVDAWETTYYHVLEGRDAVLEWVSGTTLRPILAVLDDTESARFLAAYGELLRGAYPERAGGTILPFRRIFVVATSSGS